MAARLPLCDPSPRCRHRQEIAVRFCREHNLPRSHARQLVEFLEEELEALGPPGGEESESCG